MCCSPSLALSLRQYQTLSPWFLLSLSHVSSSFFLFFSSLSLQEGFEPPSYWLTVSTQLPLCYWRLPILLLSFLPTSFFPLSLPCTHLPPWSIRALTSWPFQCKWNALPTELIPPKCEWDLNPRWFYPLLFSKQSRSTSLSSHHPLSFSLCSLFSVPCSRTPWKAVEL